MKKLMVAIAAVASAFGLYADDAGAKSGTSFEASEAVSAYWTDNNAPEVKDLAAAIPGVTRPDLYETAAFAKYGSVTGTVEMTVKETGTWDLTSQTEGALYFDSLVKLTVFDENPTIDQDAKVALWLQEELEGEVVVATNLWVQAAGGQYEVSLRKPDSSDLVDFNAFADAWHRVTVKILPSIYGSLETTTPGAVIFIDGKPVWNTTTARGYDKAKLTPIAAALDTDGKLFATAGTDTTITGVTFAGKGDVDDLVFTTTAPSFAADPNAWSITWDPTKVSAVYYRASEQGEWISVADATTGSKLFTEALIDPLYVKWVGAGNYVDGEYTINPAMNDSTAITSEYTEGNTLFNGKAYTFANAIAKAGEAAGTLKLLENVTGDIPNTVLDDTILDLAGNTLKGNVAGEIVLTNSETTVAIVNGYYGATGLIVVDNVMFAYDANEGLTPGTCDISTDLLLPGYEFVKHTIEDVDYWVIDTIKVAQIEGGAKFATLTAAVAAAAEGDIITIFADTEEHQIVLENKSLTIVNNAVVAWDDTNTTIKDNGQHNGAYSFTLKGSLTLTLEGSGTWKKEVDTGAMFRADPNSTATIIANAGTFIAGTQTSDAGYEADMPNTILQAKAGGTIIVNGGSFKNYRNDAFENGRCVAVEGVGASVTINGGTFENGTNCALPVSAEDDNATVSIPALVNEVLNGAKFSKDESKYLTDSGYEFVLDGTFYKLAAKTVYTITTTTPVNADVTLDPVNGQGYADDTVTITSVAKENFTYEGVDLQGTDWVYDSDADKITLVVTIATTVQITVPDAVAEATEPIPEIDPAEAGAAEKIAAVFADATDKTLATKITTENYTAFRTWAKSFDADAATSENMVLASSLAAVSFEYKDIVAEPTLFEDQPELKIAEVATGADGVTFKVSLTAGEDDIALAKEAIAQMIKVGTAIDSITSDPTIITSPAADGVNLEFTVEKPGETAGFIKIAK